MSKHYSKKRRLKYVLLALTCTASFSLTGLAAACTTNSNDEDETKTTREDTQLLKNGDFEFFDVPAKKKDEPAPIYLINTPNNWTRGGTSSYTMSGIIGTSETAWNNLTSDTLASDLDLNNALDSSASDYKQNHVDYNGMKSSDLLYKDTYAALNYKEDDEDKDENAKDPRGEFIANPETHYNVHKNAGGNLVYVDDEGNEQPVYEDENGDYFLEYDEVKKEYKQPFSHVLMLHNYATEHNGIAQNYSSVDIELPANTSAEVSVWVKTVELVFDQGKKVSQDRGANIYVSHTVGNSSLDDFAITCINTEKLIDEGKASDDYNGWVKYTVYINACDFASSNITLKLGLGETGNTVEGYAFFDDVSVTKYASLDNDNCSYGDYENAIKTNEYTTEAGANGEKRKAFCTLTSDASEKIFKVDSYSRNGGVISERFSDNFHYLIDLASENYYDNVSFKDGGAKAGLTVDTDNYVSSTNIDKISTIGFDGVEGLGNKVKTPVNFTSLDTSRDLLAYVKAGYAFTESDSKYYYNRLNDALESVKSLPKLGDDAQMMVMLSAYGAAYTSSFDIEVRGERNQIISFWVKTSDMNGNTAATVKLTEKDNKDNSVSFSVESTNVVTNIGDKDDEKDIYNGWVQCFFFVKNELQDPAKLTVEFSFGNTTIKGTTVSNYKAGWVALANMQTLDVDDDIFAYTGSGDYTASLTVVEDEEKKTSPFDQAYGSQAHEIEKGLVNPSSYTGVNGSSSSVMNSGHVSIPFDDINQNDHAGLINKEHVENYVGQDWYVDLLDSFNATSGVKALENWNEVFGNKCTQPLIIVNQLRESYVWEKSADENTYKGYYVKNKETGKFEKVKDDAKFDESETYYSPKQVMNYGFIGTNKSVSSGSYATVSVRVKVSAGAIAYIYLVDTSAGKNVLGYSTPSYSFWYDVDGNVLYNEPDPDATLAQQRENVLYTLLDNGLFKGKDGKYYANTWNYTKLYNNENTIYYNEKGEPVSFENLIKGETYYVDAQKSKEADHFLVTNDGIKVFKYTNGTYYNIEKGETTVEVNPFDRQYARYTGVTEDYVQIIGDSDDEVGKWITVNFVIHAGSENKSYRLELWSGERDKTVTAGNNEKGSVIFDYSYTNVSNDDLKNEYENEIIKAYQKLLAKKGLLKDLATSEENIVYYEKLVESYIGNGIIQEEVDAIKKDYNAHYYTFSLYDSANYQPFNKETANDGSTGYNYSVSDYSEALSYLSVKDGDTYTVFADYSTVDQSIELDKVSDDDDEDEDEDKDDGSVWLLVSSIVLVVVLLFAMLSLFVKDAMKKLRRKKVYGKNKYNKANRYIRKLGIKKEEIEETDGNDETVEDETTSTDVEVNEEVVEETEVKEDTSEEQTPDNPEDGQN